MAAHTAGTPARSARSIKAMVSGTEVTKNPNPVFMYSIVGSDAPR
jgi:hypothetical protein